MLVDTHCHIEDFPDKQSAIDRALKSGVSVLINSGSDVISSRNSKELSEEFLSVYFSAGVHPDSAQTFDDEKLNAIRGLCLHEKCVAVGEIGLDYHYDPISSEKQKAAFIKQIELANALNLPVVIHSRDAHADTLEIVKNHRPDAGTMHCFSGSKEIAKEYLDIGLYLSFGGTLTFKNNVKTVEVLKYAPLDRVLTETDSPYLSPEPKRGTKNEPANVKYVALKIAELKSLPLEKVEQAIYENVRRLFKKIK